MTSTAKREEERFLLRRLFEELGRDLPQSYDDKGETPDFILQLEGKRVGVEVTWYQTGEVTDDGVPVRRSSSEWYKLRDLASDYAFIHPLLKDMSVHLDFKGAVPTRNKHQALLDEITAFALERASELGPVRREYANYDFTSPLLKQYLHILEFQRETHSFWTSDYEAGWVAQPDETLTEIAAAKATKTYRDTDELWLVIAAGYHKGEALGAMSGLEDFESIAGWEPAMKNAPFHRVFVLSFGGGFEWRKNEKWRAIKA